MEVVRAGSVIATYWLNYGPVNTGTSGVTWAETFVMTTLAGDTLRFFNTPTDITTLGMTSKMPVATDVVDALTPHQIAGTSYWENAMQVDLIGMEWDS